jgi:hypothetical protein
MLSEELAEAENMHSKLADILPMHWLIQQSDRLIIGRRDNII